MSDPKPADDRAARLAEALRANLRRRKGQARDRDTDAPAAPPAEDPKPSEKP